MFAPRAGRFLAAFALLLAGLALLLVGGTLPGGFDGLGLLLIPTGVLVFLAVFFRDPERRPGPDIVSPADGRVALVERVGGRLRIAVFMNVHNVHVNRFPMDARVEAVGDAGHGFLPAYRPEAENNVQREYRLATAVGPVEVRQITGIVARRLVSFVRPGETHHKGDRLGMIVLGSRVDVVLPEDRTEPLVRAGDRVSAGSTPIARVRA